MAKEADARERLREQTEFRGLFHDLADKRYASAEVILKPRLATARMVST